MTNRRKRSPNGIQQTKPIALRLMPTEKIVHAEISKALNLTESALARKAYLAGLKHCVIDTTALPPVSSSQNADNSRGDSESDPAFFTEEYQ